MERDKWETISVTITIVFLFNKYVTEHLLLGTHLGAGDADS